jgi:hypothetical protein
MAFNINEFSAQMNKRGLAKNNMFLVTITVPNSMGFLNSEIPSKELQFLCKSSSLPSLDIATQDVRMQGWGKIEKRPSDFTKNNLNLIFMVDSEFATLRFFHRWMQGIVNWNELNGENSEDPQGKLPYEFEYKKNYTAMIQIDVYSDNLSNLKYTYRFSGAFPVTIGNIELAWENASEIMTLAVSFAYDSTDVDALAPTTTSNRAAFPTMNASSRGGSSGNIGGGSGGGFLNFNVAQPIQDIVNRVTAPLNTALNRITQPLNNIVSSIRNIRF